MNKMENMEIKQLVVSMSLPIIISMVIQALYNIVDSIFVAKISSDALTAVSLCYPVQTIMIAIACGTAVGFNTLLARYLGEKKFDFANNTMMHGILLGFVNGLVFLVLGLLFSNVFLSLFTSDQNVIPLANTYIRICTMFSFSVFVQIIFERIMQATGNAIYNMVMQGAGAIINIILDPILIFGWFGLPEMGVAGAAIATVIGQFCAMLIGYVITKVKIKELDIHMHNFSFSIPILCKIYKVGVPAILMQSVLSFMTVFMNMILAPISAMAITVFSVYYKLQNFLNMAVLGITNALIPIVAFNLGAKHADRIKKVIRLSGAYSALIGLVGLIIMEMLPVQLISAFAPSEEMFSLGVTALRILGFSFVFGGVSVMICYALQGFSRGISSLIISALRQVIILLPLASILGKAIGINGIWWSFLISETVTVIRNVRHRFQSSNPQK